MNKKQNILNIIFMGLMLFQIRSLNSYPVDTWFADGNLWYFGNITHFTSIIDDPFAPFPDTLKPGYKSGLIVFGSGSNQPWNLILKTLARWGKWCGEPSFLITVFPGLCAYYLGGWILFARLLDKICLPARCIGSLVYIFLPLGVNISRSIIPEVYAILLLAIQIYFLNTYYKTISRSNLALFIISFCISTYFFPKNGIVMLCMTSLFAFSEKIYKKNNCLIWATTLLLFWCLICKYIYTKYNWTAGHGEQILVKQILLSQAFWKGWLNVIQNYYHGIFVVVPLAILLSKRTSLLRLNICGILLGYFTLGIYFSYHTYTHSYYSYPLILVLSLSWTALVETTTFYLTKIAAKRIYYSVVSSAFIVVILWLYGTQYVNIVNERNNSIKKAQIIKERYNKIDEITHQSKKVIFFTEANGTYFQSFSMSDGFGWPSDGNYFGEKAVGKWIGVSKDEYYKFWFDEYLRNGAEYFATDLIDEFKKQGAITEKIEGSHHVLYHKDGLLIYDLKHQK